jgi:DNA polymerase-4
MLDLLWTRYERFDKTGRTLTLKVKFNDFSIRSRSKTLQEGITNKILLKQLAEELNNLFVPLENPIRLLGFQISGFAEKEFTQLKFEL